MGAEADQEEGGIFIEQIQPLVDQGLTARRIGFCGELVEQGIKVGIGILGPVLRSAGAQVGVPKRIGVEDGGGIGVGFEEIEFPGREHIGGTGALDHLNRPFDAQTGAQ